MVNKVKSMITFHIEQTPFRLANRRGLRAWLKQVAADEGKTPGDIACVFCSDDYLLSVNKTYLHHDYLTDVITFDYSWFPVIAGDLLISVDTVRANAQKYGVPFEEELRRVMVHGVLHLCGYRDATKAEAAAMHKREDLHLAKMAT